MDSSPLYSFLKPAFKSLSAVLADDADFQASAAGVQVDFGISAHGSDKVVLMSVGRNSVTVREAKSSDATFTLSARQDDWEKFFQSPPPRFYQSYWGLLRTFAGVEGVCILGDSSLFSKHARIWRIVLDRIRDCLARAPTIAIEDVPEVELEDDSIVGRYTWIDLPKWGKCKIFYETSGDGSQDLLFLHTAGADSRQSHSVMNNKEMQARSRMFAFDLPNHGRSYPASKISPDGFALDEEMYIDVIVAMVQKLKLNKPVLCGASMGGQVCIAAAIRAKELGLGGVIPLEGCANIPATPSIYEAAGEESMLNPERVCGMISPTAPEYYRRLIWWIYSSQGLKVFPGDLRFYFGGWDGTSRLKEIDTSTCPVYMLTGEYDYSCSYEMSEKTAKQIPGAVCEKMQGLGHFPITEDPERFMPHMLKALDHIQKHRTT